MELPTVSRHGKNTEWRVVMADGKIQFVKASTKTGAMFAAEEKTNIRAVGAALCVEVFGSN